MAGCSDHVREFSKVTGMGMAHRRETRRECAVCHGGCGGRWGHRGEGDWKEGGIRGLVRSDGVESWAMSCVQVIERSGVAGSASTDA